MKGTGSVPFILPFAKGEINILNNAITNYLFALSQGEKGYYFGRSYYQIIISAKGRKGISITINSTPTTLLPDILGYKFPMQIRIYSRSLKESFFFYLQHFYPLLLSLCSGQGLWFWFLFWPSLVPSCWKSSEERISEAERICSRSVEIQERSLLEFGENSKSRFTKDSKHDKVSFKCHKVWICRSSSSFPYIFYFLSFAQKRFCQTHKL